MAFRMSDKDKAAIKAAAAIRQSNQAQADYDALMPQAMAKLSQANQGPSNPLESVLSGIGNSVKNVGDTLYNMFGTGAASVRDLVTGNAGTGKYTKEWEQYAKKTLHGDENMSDKDYYAKTGGKALDAAATVSDLIPGLGAGKKVALNIGQGVVSGAANPFIEKGASATLDDALKGALVGGASAGVGQYVGGKLANRTAGKGLISKALNSNIGKGAITGGLAGATGGGLYAGLNGGDVLQGALQGAQGGAMAGGTMAGAMGVLGSGIDRLNRKYGETPQAPDTPTTKPIVDDVAEQYTRPAAQEAPTRRQIDVQYDDSGNGAVDVNRQRRSMYRLPDRSGSTLDGILGPNNKTQLPNAIPNSNAQFRKLFDDNTSDISAAVRNGFLDAAGDDAISKNAVLKDILDSDTYNQLRAATRDYADYANSSLDGYNVASKSELPKIRTSDYIEATGYKGKDIPDYMRPFLSEENGTSLKDSSWSQIMPEYNNGGQFTGTPDDILEMYDNLANTNRNLVYTNENLIGALETDPDLYMKATEQLLADSFPTRKIDVDKRLPQGEQIDVNNPNRGQLIQDVMPAQRRQPQPQAQPVQEAQSVAPRVRRATDMSNIQEAPNLDPADVARLEREITVNRQKQGAALLEQYGDLDNPTRRAVGSAEDVLATLYNSYGLKTPADVQYASNHVTGENGLVSQMTRELASSAKNVDTTITRDWLDDIRTDIGLSDEEYKTVLGQIKSALKRTEKSNDGNTTLDAIRQLEKQSARYKGKDKTYHLSTDPEKRKGMTLDLVRDELQGRLWEAAGDPKKVLTPERLTELKNMYKGNQTWADFVDNKLAKVRNGAELRATMKPLVDGSTIVNGAKMSAGGFGANMKRLVTSGHPLQAFGQMAYDLAAGSEPAKQARAAKYAGNASNAQAQLEGKAPVQQAKTGLVGTAKNIGQKAINKAGKAAEMLNNDTFSGREISPITRKGQTQTIGDVAMRRLSRQAGLGAMQQQDRQNAIQNATQEAQGIQNNYENSMLQAQQLYNQAQQVQEAIPSSLDRISAGMERALAAGDITAYGKLADLYKQAAQIYKLQNPTATTTAKDLSANQSKALTGLQQLQTLSQMQPGVGTALVNSPLGGVVNMFGGDEYANQAQSLALTLGYLQSGANITPREAENIGKSYIPTAYDSENVRQQKLSRAEQLLRNYLADTSALQQ